MSYDPTSILIVNGEILSYGKGSYSQHYNALLDRFGTLYIESEPYAGEAISFADELDEWCDVHAGILTDCCGLVDEDGNIVDWLILTDPFYRFELDGNLAADVETFCSEHGIEYE